MPISLLSLVDTDRQWLKARIGLPGVSEIPRDVAFCAHAIQSDELLEVSDTTLDSRFTHNPQVTGRPDIRFKPACPCAWPTGTGWARCA